MRARVHLVAAGAALLVLAAALLATRPGSPSGAAVVAPRLDRKAADGAALDVAAPDATPAGRRDVGACAAPAAEPAARPAGDVLALFRSSFPPTLLPDARHVDEPTLEESYLARLRRLVLEHDLASDELVAAALLAPEESLEEAALLLGLAWTSEPLDDERVLARVGARETDGDGVAWARWAFAHALSIRGDDGHAARRASALLLHAFDLERDLSRADRVEARILLRGLRNVATPAIEALVERLTSPTYASHELAHEAWALAARAGDARMQARVLAAARTGDEAGRALRSLTGEALVPELAALLLDAPLPPSRSCAGEAAAALVSIGTSDALSVLQERRALGLVPRDVRSPAAVGALFVLRRSVAGDLDAAVAVETCIARSLRSVDWLPHAAAQRDAMVRSLRSALGALPAGSIERARVARLLAEHEGRERP